MHLVQGIEFQQPKCKLYSFAYVFLFLFLFLSTDEHVSLDVGKVMQRGRQDKNLTQKELATVSYQCLKMNVYHNLPFIFFTIENHFHHVLYPQMLAIFCGVNFKLYIADERAPL